VQNAARVMPEKTKRTQSQRWVL